MLFGLGPAHAQRVALLIGNANYQSAPLRNPPGDVREMEAALRAVGFRVQTVLNANQNQMKRAVRDFGNLAQGADIAFLYYSGHGTQANGENYLIPLQATIEKEADYEVEAVSANALMRQITNARPKAAIVVLDACRDNPYAVATKSASKGLVRMDAPTGTMIAFATAPNTTASDEGHYARALAAQIRTPGLELFDVFRNTTVEVRRLSGGKQEPRVSEVSITDRIYLAGLQALDASAEPRRSEPDRPAPPSPEPLALRPGQIVKDCDVCPEMVVIPAGEFLMGSGEGEAGRRLNEGPQRRVGVRELLLGRTEVTQGQWKVVMGNNPSRFSSCGDDCPVERVSWEDAQEYARRLSAKTGKEYRLPSEAEWEYSARAGSQSRWSHGNDESQLGQHAWFAENSEGKTQRVAGKRANGFGLYDMHGNVREWVQDCYEAGAYRGKSPNDGRAYEKAGCSARGLRGGSWYFEPAVARSAYRYGDTPGGRDVDVGFRLARMLP